MRGRADILVTSFNNKHSNVWVLGQTTSYSATSGATTDHDEVEVL